MCEVRKVQAGLPDGGRYDRQQQKANEWDGMHPVYGMREGVPTKSVVRQRNVVIRPCALVSLSYDAS